MGALNTMDNYQLFDLLLKAEGESEVDDILRKVCFLNDNSDVWQPFGGFGNPGMPPAQPNTPGKLP